MYHIPKVYQEILTNMKPKILVSRKISDLAEEKLQKEFEATLNQKDEPIPESELIKNKKIHTKIKTVTGKL